MNASRPARLAPRALLCAVTAACARPAPPGDSGAPVDATDAVGDDAAAPPPPVSDLPLIPVGADAYRDLARLPYHRIGARTYMRSTYDRAGGNDAADASHFLRVAGDGATAIPLDLEGPGALLFVRTNHWHGSPWHYTVDGTDHVVTESSTADPDHPIEGSVFQPAALFPSPLAVTWSTTRGADLSWVPVAFERSFTLGYGRTHYGTGYYIFQSIAPGTTHVTRPLRAWDGTTPPDADALALLSRAGQDIAPPAGEPGVRAREGTLAVTSSAPALLADLGDGPAVLRALVLSVPRASADVFARAVLRVRWDARDAPSIDAPVALFFGAGTLRNPEGRALLVGGLLANIRFDAERVTLAMYYPMPYQRAARIELQAGAGDPDVPDVRWQIRAVPYTDPPGYVGYFHASYRDHGAGVPGQDLVLLDTRQAEGGGDWCGSFAGTSFVFTDRAELGTLEGDPRFFFDDSQSPQGQGTGTEEWAGGGDYWGGRTMTLPLAGHPVGIWPPTSTTDPLDLVHSAYRFLLADVMPFGRNARIQLEHGATNDSTEHYRTVTYWYGAPGACLVPTDAFHVGDPADEQSHAYVSPTAGDVETITSRYEWGVDHLGATEVFPASTDTGRRMTGTSEFTLRVDPANVGVLLRRKLDYAIADQRAEVYVADGDVAGAAFTRVGIWYTAGSNRCVYSNPPSETGALEPVVQTSNRRFRDDEFLLPRSVTAGRRAIRVRVVFAPQVHPLLPGDTGQGPPAWSEMRYQAYSYVLPAR